MREDFLLNSELSRRLYMECAANLPVIDYHNHLSVEDIVTDRRFENLYDLWLAPDPYKHRAMRMCGVPEEKITGKASAEEKFEAWCSIFPKLVGNPLYQWSLMELQDVMQIKEIPGAETWRQIWHQSKEYLATCPVTAQGILKKAKVEYNSPCAEITDDISLFVQRKDLAPSLRGDTILNPSESLIRKLEQRTEEKITDLDRYKNALRKQFWRFIEAGCHFSDHALDNGFHYYKEDGKNEKRFQDVIAGDVSGREERDRLASALLRFLGGLYAEYRCVMQLHMGAQRDTSTRLRSCAGAAGGYACIGNSVDIASLVSFLDDLEKQPEGLPRIILFSLNPADHALLSCLSGSYSKDHEPGLVTQGPAWWWCDHSYGITSVLESTASYGLLSNFPGMTTDSRSFLSFIRHDYFRRLLCNWLAKKALEKEIPQSVEILEELIDSMCCKNARRMLQ